MILDFLSEMLFYMAISLPFILFLRYGLVQKKRPTIWLRELVLICFFMFLVGLASQTIMPNISFYGGLHIVPQAGTGLNLKPFLVIAQTQYEVFVNGNINYFLINFVGNILIFMPIGLFIPYLWGRKWFFTLFTGFFISLIIEFTQLFIARGTDVDDLILNTLGTLLGYLLFLLCRILFKGKRA